MKNPTRTRVATGIYQDQCGILVTVSHGGRRRGKRFPPDTPIALMANRRMHMLAGLAEEHVAAECRWDGGPMSSERVAELFRALKKVRAKLTEVDGLTTRAIAETASDRELVAAAGPDDTDVVELHELCCRLIDDRQRLAIALECIRLDLERVDLVPRTENRGKKARSTP